MYDINKIIAKRFQPTLDEIKRQTECQHVWPDKLGAAYYRCSQCGYNADDMVLDKAISVQKMLDKGMTQAEIERVMKYL
jgi:rubrerythrin